MGEFFEEHGEGGDVKAARPENAADRGNHSKTKVDMAPNTKEGTRNEPSHSGPRVDPRSKTERQRR